MREKIKQLVKEEFEYQLPELFISEESIHISLEAGTSFYGSFFIKSSEGMDGKGIVYSSDNRMKITNPMFTGSSSEIRYSFDGKWLEAGAVYNGKIYIVSNCGETWIPYFVTICKPFCNTSLGYLKDVFQFANLAQMDWREALNLFESPEFSRVLIEKEEHKNFYESLKKSYSSSIAMEEFLLKLQKKAKIGVTLEKNQFTYSNITMSFMDKVILLKDSWGYESFSISTVGEFLSTEKLEINTEDFLSNRFELEFYIDSSQMKPGKHFGKIIISSATREMIVEIQAVIREGAKERRIQRQIKKERSSIIKNYLKLRTNGITHEVYVLELAKILKRIKTDYPYFEYLLLEAHYYITDGQSEAELCLKELEEKSKSLKEASVVYYCAYLYLKASYTKEDKDKYQGAKIIKNIYEKEDNSFAVFWFLLYLEEGYAISQDKKWRDTLSVLERGVTSPILYFEVCSMIRKNDHYLKQLTPVVIRSLNWGIKMNFLTKELVEGYCFLLLQGGKPPKSILSGFIALYEKYPGRELLNSICMLIIQQEKAENVHNKYLKWFVFGEEEKLRLENFYEYYLYSSMGDLNKKLPTSLLTFFNYDNELPWEKKAYLYAYIVKRKNEDIETYVNYHKRIKKFAYEQIKKERMNENLAILYEEFIQCNEIEEGIGIHLAKIMFRHEIICQNPKMVGIYIKHKELETENYVILENGKAFVDICTENVTISFADRRGNRYISSIDYTVTKLLNISGLVERCFEFCKTNPMILLNLFEDIDHYQKQSEDSIAIQRRCVLLPNFNRYYKGRCYGRLIEYYFDHMEQELLEEILRIVELEYVSKNYRKDIIQYFIIHRLRERTILGLLEYGFEGVTLNRLIKFCTRELEKMDKNEKNTFMLDLCFYIFREEKYNEIILEYLVLHFNGATKTMLWLWKCANGFGLDTYGLEERILSQVLFAESYVRSSSDVFCSFYEKYGEEKIISAYLGYSSFLYLIFDRPLKEEIFLILRKEINYENNMLNQLAVLKYFSEVGDLSKEDLEFCERYIWKFKDKGFILPFFKDFQDKITLPEEITNYYFVEYKCNPKKEVQIHYIMDYKNMDGGYRTEVMKNVYHGIHVKEFLLFQDEHLSYYISEKEGEIENITQSVKVVMENTTEADDSVFGLLNLMLTAREMQDEQTLLELMEYFVKLKYTSEKLFEIL